MYVSARPLNVDRTPVSFKHLSGLLAYFNEQVKLRRLTELNMLQHYYYSPTSTELSSPVPSFIKNAPSSSSSSLGAQTLIAASYTFQQPCTSEIITLFHRSHGTHRRHLLARTHTDRGSEKSDDGRADRADEEAYAALVCSPSPRPSGSVVHEEEYVDGEDRRAGSGNYRSWRDSSDDDVIAGTSNVCAYESVAKCRCERNEGRCECVVGVSSERVAVYGMDRNAKDSLFIVMWLCV